MSSNIPTTNALHAISGRRRCGASAAREAVARLPGPTSHAPIATRMPTTSATQPAAASDCVMICHALWTAGRIESVATS